MPTRGIYISSTFQDLQDERRAVIRAVKAVHAGTTAMEDQGATSRPPLERCLEDVRDADIYVGIIGWRQGSRPRERPETTYTEAEFLEATAAGKPRLAYLVNESRRPPELASDDPVFAFRRLVKDSGITCRDFGTLEDLLVYVGTDVKREMDRLDHPSVGARLPYLCDRFPQLQGIARTFATLPVDRPRVCLVHGRREQRTTEFLESLREHHLEQHFKSRPIVDLQLSWPETELDAAIPTLRQEFATKVGLDASASDDAIRHKLEQVHEKTALLISLQAPAGSFRSEELQKISDVASYFEAWRREGGKESKPDLVLIYLEYPEGSPGLWSKLVSRTNAPDRLRKTLETFALPHGVVLPELGGITLEHVTQWTKLPSVKSVTQGRDLSADVDQIFHKKRATLSMKELYPKLLALLEPGSGVGSSRRK